MRNHAHHEANRLLKFDAGTVDGDENGAINSTTSGRGEPRTGMVSLLPGGALITGDRIVVFGSGDNELPIVAGRNPWVV